MWSGRHGCDNHVVIAGTGPARNAPLPDRRRVPQYHICDPDSPRRRLKTDVAQVWLRNVELARELKRDVPVLTATRNGCRECFGEPVAGVLRVDYLIDQAERNGALDTAGHVNVLGGQSAFQ